MEIRCFQAVAVHSSLARKANTGPNSSPSLRIRVSDEILHRLLGAGVPWRGERDTAAAAAYVLASCFSV